MLNVVKLSKGLEIRLKGRPKPEISALPVEGRYALKPADFHGLTPRLLVREGDIVKAGTPLLCDKNCPEICFCSPVSGTVEAIVRGEKRLLLEVVIRAASTQEYVDFGKADPGKMSRQQIVARMLESGVWPSVVERPYGFIANPLVQPVSVFVSGFRTDPLAPDYQEMLKDSGSDFKTGMRALSRLTAGKLFLGLPAGQKISPVFEGLEQTEVRFFEGLHPAGNVGVQIHHVRPVNKGDVVWTMAPQDVMILGRLFNEGVYRPEILLALAGSEVVNPQYFKVRKGIQISGVVSDRLQVGPVRIISGNVLTGTKVSSEGYLGYLHDMVTVIPEGLHHEFLGWLMPGLQKFSISRTFFSWLCRSKEYRLDSNTNGGKRAFVFTGLYEKVVPMDIYPMQLLKACLASDLDRMEALGIYEVLDEDLALCEVICPSKTPVQEILRNGLNNLAKEMKG